MILNNKIMLKINKLKDSPFYDKKYKWITTREIVASFGEVEMEGYYQKGIMFNGTFYEGDDYCTIELDGKLIGLTPFENLQKNIQQVVDKDLYENLLNKETEEYQHYIKLKEKFDKN